LKKTLRHRGYRVTSDQYFSDVIQACAKPRERNDDSGTWITPAMIKAYTTLNESGCAHSLEVWDQMKLVGGLYGVAIGQVFFGESMFSHSTDASKVALTALVRIISEKKFQLIDCQVPSEHLFSLGARNIPRARFSGQLQAALAVESQPDTWNYSFDSLDLL
jgi:leucyl/phenylalanyl-tRNA--protein transferase